MKVNKIGRCEVVNNGVELSCNTAQIKVELVAENIIRIRQTALRTFDTAGTFVLHKDEPASFPATIEELGDKIRVSGEKIIADIHKDPFWIDLSSRSGGSFLSTPPGESVEWHGEKAVQRFNLPAGVKVFGLGQGTNGTLDLRDRERRMWQQWDGFRYSGNAGIPFLMTSLGYGLLLNSSWASRFALGKAEPAQSTKGAKPAGPWQADEHCGENHPERFSILTEGGEMDLFVLYGPDYKSILKGYGHLTGYPPLPPRWALGWIQSKNRYKTQEQLLEIGREYRRRNIPCDTLVIDWCWFKYFGDLDWVKKYWPDPVGMARELRAMGFHLLQAQHPYMHLKSPNFDRFNSHGFLISWDPSEVTDGWPPDGIKHIVDFSHPGARNLWWEKIETLFKQGIDGYWTDMGEPDTHPPSISPHYLGPREKVHNIYSLLWNKALYDGQRSSSNRRVFCLSRTAYAGIQRYGSALWSGDVDPSWEVLEDQVVTGQQVCLSGLPYWTTDIGGFMSTDFYEPELYARWIQWGAFCPVFRTHGTRPANEPWSFDPITEGIAVEYINMRYRLMPYIYALAYEAWQVGLPPTRAMLVEFPGDREAGSKDHQFMFGPSLLVAPVTGKGVREKKVWMPEGVWYNYWDDKKYSGPQEIEETAPLWKIPIFVRGGSIIPEGPAAPHTGQGFFDPLTLHVYPGADAECLLYEDDGVTYDYENGDRAVTRVKYTESSRKLEIFGAQGGYTGLMPGRAIKVVYHDGECPGKIKVNGSPLEAGAWRYRGSSRRLEIELDRIATAGDTVLELEGTAGENCQEPPAGKQALLLSCDLEYAGSAPHGYILRIYLEQTPGTENAGGKVFIKTPAGWNCKALEGSSGCANLRFLLTAEGDAFTAKSTATVELTSALGEETREIQLGSGWASWWKLARLLDVNGPEEFDQVYAPEDDGVVIMNNFKEEATITSYRGFDCFGYVNLEKVFNRKDITEMVAATTEYKLCYASCVADSPVARECYMQLMGEDRFKVWINNQLVAVVNECVARPVEYLVKLKKGENSVLIKCTQDAHLEWNDRSWGFNFRFCDDARKPLGDITYMVEKTD